MRQGYAIFDQQIAVVNQSITQSPNDGEFYSRSSICLFLAFVFNSQDIHYC